MHNTSRRNFLKTGSAAAIAALSISQLESFFYDEEKFEKIWAADVLVA